MAQMAWVELERVKRRSHIRFRDNGIGMDAEDLVHCQGQT